MLSAAAVALSAVQPNNTEFLETFNAENFADRWDLRGSFMQMGKQDAHEEPCMMLPDHLIYGREGLTMLMNSDPCTSNKTACCCAGHKTVPCTQNASAPDQTCATVASGHLLSKVSYGYGVFEAAIQFSNATGATSFWDIGEHELCESPHEETQFVYNLQGPWFQTTSTSTVCCSHV